MEQSRRFLNFKTPIIITNKTFHEKMSILDSLDHISKLFSSSNNCIKSGMIMLILNPYRK